MRNIKAVNKLIALSLAVLTSSALTVSSKAEASSISLRKQVRESRISCPALDCTTDMQLIQWTQDSNVSESTVRAAARRAQGAAENHWPDTILEGPYETFFDMEARSIEILHKGDQVIGYRVLVSAKAWEIETCNYDARVSPDLGACPPGEIVEAIFVSADGKEAFVDEEYVAQFIPYKLN